MSSKLTIKHAHCGSVISWGVHTALFTSLRPQEVEEYLRTSIPHARFLLEWTGHLYTLTIPKSRELHIDLLSALLTLQVEEVRRREKALYRPVHTLLG